MISDDDKNKLDRIDYLKTKSDIERVWLPFMIFFSIAFVSIFWFLTGKEWKVEYWLFVVVGLLSLVSFFFRLKQHRKAQEEIVKLKGELGL